MPVYNPQSIVRLDNMQMFLQRVIIIIVILIVIIMWIMLCFFLCIRLTEKTICLTLLVLPRAPPLHPSWYFKYVLLERTYLFLLRWHWLGLRNQSELNTKPAKIGSPLYMYLLLVFWGQMLTWQFVESTQDLFTARIRKEWALELLDKTKEMWG